MMYYDNTMVARIIHDAMRALQMAQGFTPSPHWHELAAEIRANAVKGVAAVREGMTPEENHERWRAQLTGQGWVYGERRDAAARTHPMLVPWAQLSDAGRDRDVLFAAIVLALTDPEDTARVGVAGRLEPRPATL